MRILLRLLHYLRPYKGKASIALFLLLVGVALDLLAPWLLKQTIDLGIMQSNMSAVLLYASLMALMQLSKSVIMYFQNILQERVGQDVVFDMRQQLYGKLQRLSFSYYDKAQTGQIMSRMTGDIDAVKNFIGFGAMFMIMGAVSGLGTLGVMLALQWKVTLISMVSVPLLLLVLWHFNKKVGPAWSDIREQMGRLTTVLQENISGIRVVKSFAKEQLEKSKFAGRNEDNFDSNMQRARIESSSFPAMQFFGSIVFLLMIWVGGFYTVKGEMSLGTLIAFQWYAWGIMWPLNMLGWLINIMQQALKAAPRVFEIMDAPLDIVSPNGGGIPAAQLKGRVTFQNVSFSFQDTKAKPETEEMIETNDMDGIDNTKPKSALHNINLDVHPGEVSAILGATGSGKSSLTNLIPRFYEATAGKVLIDQVDVREYNLEQLRMSVGIVPQETFLFSATIRDNIAYGMPDATMTQIEESARKAQIHDFIHSLPNGYDTLIGERGVGLSGGQRQRVALARAILMDPPILILDEATASVDTATEAAIHEGMEEIMRGKTTFIIAQRLSTIQRADRIIVLDQGEIVEQGTHRELYQNDGFFRQLFQMQHSVAQ